MGNEMGNNNVSGSQEQEKTDAEAPNTSQDFYEKDTGLNSGEPSGVSDPHIGKEASDIKEPDKQKVQQSDGKSEALLVPKDTDSASEKSPSGTNDHQIQKEISIGKEGEETKKSSLDTESITPGKESTESVSQSADPSKEDGKKLQGSNEDILGSNESRVSEKNEEKLNNISTTEAAKNRDDRLTEKEMESQKSKNDEHMTETSAGVMVGKATTLLNDAEKGEKEEDKEFIHKTFPLSKKESQIDDSNVIDNGFNNNKMSLDGEKNGMVLKKEEKVFEISASPIASNTNIEAEKLLECYSSPSHSIKERVDSNMVLGTPKDNGSSSTGLNQEGLGTKVDAKAGSSFHAENGIANIMSSQKQDSENNPLLHQTVSVESKQSVEPLLDARNSESDRTPLLNQEKTSKNIANVRNPILETVALELEEKSVEKQVIALERTSTEKMKAPLLNFMKEENHVIESPNKQEGIVANEEGIPPERKKQKPKYSLFTNCMCCTAVTQ